MADKRLGTSTAGDDELLTVQEVSQRLKISSVSIRKWLRQGRLHGLKLGGGKEWRIQLSEFRRFTGIER